MGFEFSNPAMLFGTLLFGVPLIIHLLNRRRYKQKQWAAMDFLMTAYKQTRRKLRFENLILLLLRCLLIILLAFAMAKPFVSSQSSVAALTSVRRDVVVVLDNSYSMGYHLTSDETCFELAKKQIRALLSELDTGRGDTATMILMGTSSEYIVPLRSPPEVALARLDRLKQPSQRGADFSALAAFIAGELSESIQGAKEVYLFTDLQARTFNAGLDGDRKATAKLLKGAAEKGAEICFVDVGQKTAKPHNLVVTQVEALDPYVTANTPATFVATVRNFGDTQTPDCRGSFVLDGKTVEMRLLDLKPGVTASAECTLVLRDPGLHNISFQLERDNLPLDDERWCAFDARSRVNVLLVDGRFDEDPFRSGTGELARVIDPTLMEATLEQDTGTGTVFEPVVIDFNLFNAGGTDLYGFDCIMLVDVDGTSGETTDALTEYVSGGGSLVIFLGENVDIQAYNQRLFPEAGDRLLPAPLDEVMGETLGIDSMNYFRLSVSDPRHPIFDVFNDPRYKPLLEVPVFRFIRVGDVPEESNVVAMFTDTMGRSFPAVLEKKMGKGRVVLITTSTSSSWSLLSESPITFLPMVHNLLYYLTAHDPFRFNLGLGDTIRRTVAEFPERIVLAGPSGDRTVVTEEVGRAAGDRYKLPLSNMPLDAAGPYLLQVDFSLSGNNLRECYTANVDPAESDLTRLEDGGLESLFPGSGPKVIGSPVKLTTESKQGVGKGELWPTLLILLLVLAGLELVLSWKFGNYA